MFNHAPNNYDCPFCLVIGGVENEKIETKQSDVFFKDREITAWISSRWWPKNPGNVIIVPNTHYENLYDLPDQILAHLSIFSKKVAIALKKTYPCDGTSVRQHNEPDGNQDVWHYHFQVFPRYRNDHLYENHPFKKIAPTDRKKMYAQQLKDYFKDL